MRLGIKRAGWIAAVSAGWFVTAAAAGVFYPAVGAATTLSGGDRSLGNLSFGGSSTIFTGADFLRFDDGYLYRETPGVALFGWNDPQPRDMNSSGNVYAFNPDRADNASLFAGEAGSTGTLAEVFGSGLGGYKNMSWILDGEEVATRYYVDLLLGAGLLVSDDGDATTIEVALLERGGNSDMNVYGILGYDSLGNAILTPALFVSRAEMGPELWRLDTLEINGEQKVTGVGISVDASWQNVIGIRVESAGASFGGPDLVAVGVVPEPQALALLALGLLGIRRR